MSTQAALKRRIERSGQTVDIAPEGERGLWHDQTPGSATTHNAIVEESFVEVLSEDTGEQELRRGSRVFMAGDVTVGLQDVLTMPNGDTPRIVDVDKQRDHHGTVVLTVVEVV